MSTYGYLEKYIKRLVGRPDIEDALGRLDRLTQDEIRMAVAQGLKATHEAHDEMQAINVKARSIDNEVKAVDDAILHAVDNKAQTIEDKVQVVDHMLQGVDDRIELLIDGMQFVFDKSPSQHSLPSN